MVPLLGTPCICTALYVSISSCDYSVVQVTYSISNKTMSLRCSSAEPGSSKTSCLSEFSGKYADMLCEFCCTSHDYCNALPVMTTVTLYQ